MGSRRLADAPSAGRRRQAQPSRCRCRPTIRAAQRARSAPALLAGPPLHGRRGLQDHRRARRGSSSSCRGSSGPQHAPPRSAWSCRLSFFVWRLFVLMKRRLLWRVRRKLILSYIFIGVVPSLLIIGFFLLGGVLVFMNVSAYLFKDGYDDMRRRRAADCRGGGARRWRDRRARRRRPSSACSATVRRRSATRRSRRVHSGAPPATRAAPSRADAWEHLRAAPADPSRAAPEWIRRRPMASRD